MRVLKVSLIALILCVSLTAGEVPRPAPALKFTTVDGETMSLEDLKGNTSMTATRRVNRLPLPMSFC